MFLIRVAFFLAIVVILLPSDERQQAYLQETIGGAIENVSTFCERKPNTCAAASDLWATFVKKAEFGARLAAELVNKRMRGGEETSPLREPAMWRGPRTDGVAEPERGTLRPTDLTPTWRGPYRRTGI
jgi:hypothetical protein